MQIGGGVTFQSIAAHPQAGRVSPSQFFHYALRRHYFQTGAMPQRGRVSRSERLHSQPAFRIANGASNG